MVDNVSAAKGAIPPEANHTFDTLVRPKTPKQSRVFIGTRGDDTYTGTNKSDFAFGGGGDDTLKGKGGNDFLSGGSGNDKINGGSGNDRIYGGRGNDTIHTGTGSDKVKAGSGDDKIVVKGSAVVDGGAGKDTVVLKGAQGDYVQAKIGGSKQLYFDQRDGSRIELTNVETVRFSEITPPPPPPPVGEGKPLTPNDAGAERIIVGDKSIRILGPNTDFTFTQLSPGPALGAVNAQRGEGIINGVKTTAVPIGRGTNVLEIGPFGFTGIQTVDAAFANGVRLDAQAGTLPTPPPPPPTGKGQRLAPNDAGAERIIVGTDSVRILGPNTDFTFTGLRDQRPVDGPLTASAGSGVINGEKVTAVPIGFGEAVFSLGSGFNPTGTQAVVAAFSNGVKLDSQIVREPITPPVPPLPPVPPKPPVGEGQQLGKNTIGAERIFVGLNSVRITGPNTDFTFTGLQDGRPADGPLTARAGSGIINGVQTTAVSLGNSNPLQPGNAPVFSLSAGFNPTGTQTVMAAFATGDRLDTTIVRFESLPVPPIVDPAPPYPTLPFQPPVSKI